MIICPHNVPKYKYIWSSLQRMDGKTWKTTSTCDWRCVMLSSDFLALARWVGESQCHVFCVMTQHVFCVFCVFCHQLLYLCLPLPKIFQKWYGLRLREDQTVFGVCIQFHKQIPTSIKVPPNLSCVEFRESWSDFLYHNAWALSKRIS